MTRNNDCVLMNGQGPIGETCKNCKYIRSIFYKDTEISVCDYLYGADIRADYRACGKFEPTQEEVEEKKAA